MEAINPFRVMLFWDSEIARDAYGPYFTGTIQKSWTLPTNRIISRAELVKKILKYRDIDHNLSNVRITMRVPSYYEVHRMFYFNLYSMNNDEKMHYLCTIQPHLAKEGIHILVEFEPIQQQNIPNTQDKNTTTLPEHITAVTQMVSDEPSMLYSTINSDDDEVDGSDGDDVVSNQSKSDDDNDLEEGEFQTPLNPVNPVNPSSQWFSSARYDYTHSGAFLDMGSGSPIDDLVESGTVRLLDWNDSMTDIQLGMRFVDKVQVVSAVHKYSINMGRDYRVLKSKIDTWTARCYHHSEDNYCS
ncbi:hypothetical protein M9H77_17513 [Catharanthus roseus]|uniref:Uncharacterized protein n=1 Tax=Catharanthus roseus TaxID=4058 RepID=A0ACC0B4T4_CATRO|nr:hypothetical protein M9H77_17513 [Catharanthus roseus]